MPVHRLVVGSIPTRGDEIFIYIYFFIYSLRCREENAALSSATQYAIPAEIGGKWGMECLNTRFPLPTMLCAGYSMKLKKNKKYMGNGSVLMGTECLKFLTLVPKMALEKEAR